MRLYQQVLECSVDILAIYLSKNDLPQPLSFSVNLDEYHEPIVPTSMRHSELLLTSTLPQFTLAVAINSRDLDLPVKIQDSNRASQSHTSKIRQKPTSLHNQQLDTMAFAWKAAGLTQVSNLLRAQSVMQLSRCAIANSYADQPLRTATTNTSRSLHESFEEA